MHAMMAVSSCHLQHMDIDAKEYRRPEALHCHFASQGLRSAVSMMSGPKDCDAVLSTAMMLNTLTFCLADYRDEPPFEGGSTQEPRYDWLRIQIGLTTLLCETIFVHGNRQFHHIGATGNQFGRAARRNMRRRRK